MAVYKKENVVIEATGGKAKELELQGFEKVEPKKEKPKKKGDQ